MYANFRVKSFEEKGCQNTTVSYNASAVKIYNATSSQVRFKKTKIVSSILEKRFSLLPTTLA
jgi:hypothetical protein